MLKKVKAGKGKLADARVAVVASTYNRRYVDGMLDAASAELARAGAGATLVRVPGAFEIPVAAAELARGGTVDAVVCLGVILRGATHHAQTICDAITQSLSRIAVDTGVPVIHEVLMVENEQQARERCLDAKSNRGLEAAATALEMIRVMRRLR